MNTSNEFHEASSASLEGADRTTAIQGNDASLNSEFSIEQSPSIPLLSAVFNVEVHHPDATDREDWRAHTNGHEASTVPGSAPPDRKRDLSERFDAAAQNGAPAPPTNELPSSRGQSAEAELEVLQDGRAKPVLNDNLPPPKYAAKAVHAEIEAWREVRIVELRAIVAAQNERANELTDEHGLAM